MADPVLTLTDRGLYCAAGGFYIDPWRPVDRALVTHGHADHARPGHRRYLATHAALPVMRHRLGAIEAEGIAFGETRRIGDALVSFHPAGHLPGSAQIRVEVGGEIWVVSGDYKTDADGLCEPFEPVRCHGFVSECTFGLPVFTWAPQDVVAQDINAWWAANAADGRPSILAAYSLGKAQRVMSLVDPSIGPILTHGAVENTNAVLRAQGYALPDTDPVGAQTKGRDHPGALVIAPPSALGSAWARRFTGASTAFASGWMALRGVRRRRAADRGFVLSDHADWRGLIGAIRDTGAETVLVTHGYTDIFARWLASEGWDAHVLATEFGSGEEDDAVAEGGAAAEGAGAPDGVEEAGAPDGTDRADTAMTGAPGTGAIRTGTENHDAPDTGKRATRAGKPDSAGTDATDAPHGGAAE